LAIACTAAVSRASSFATLGDAFLLQPGEQRLIQVGGDHLGTLARQRDGCGAADTAPAAVQNAILPSTRLAIVSLPDMLCVGARDAASAN
jgi:hypothetical protein